jgi:hypothetical protein
MIGSSRNWYLLGSSSICRRAFMSRRSRIMRSQLSRRVFSFMKMPTYFLHERFGHAISASSGNLQQVWR